MECGERAADTRGMARLFAFNGDADGLCALQQLALVEPQPIDTLVTGPKRRIALLAEVDPQSGDEVTVLDVSFDVNREAVRRLLAKDAFVRYFDHHYAGEVAAHPRLAAYIDPSPGACTSTIVDGYLAGAQRRWAIVGAFGDGLDETARRLAAAMAEEEVARLRELGTALNYNAYGESEADLHFPPAELHRRLRRYPDPLTFVHEDGAFARLRQGYEEDLERAHALSPYAVARHAAVYVLPDAAWARRVSGVLATRLARGSPERAHAVLSPLSAGGWQVSVRSPLARLRGAAAFCRRYPGGGGREAAAGINRLPADALVAFADAFLRHFRPSEEVIAG